MMRAVIYLAVLLFAAWTTAGAQSIESQLLLLDGELEKLEQEKRKVQTDIENLKLQRIRRDLKEVGLPAGPVSQELIWHEALCLSYNEEHEQANWVAHIITPDIISGKEVRSNDFRVDPLIPTGTAVEEDYFLKFLQADSSYKYDGFGYDRGHLAPSADFRWSAKALSESYYYSNMSPQLPEFNREKWAELEGALRGYIYKNPEVQLYVVTGPVLGGELQVIERGVNKVSIPSFFWKIAVDLKNNRGIGFIMPHKNLTGFELSTFAVNIDEVEKTAGLNFFAELPDEVEEQIEGDIDLSKWLDAEKLGDRDPIYPPSLPKNHFNTIQAKRFMDRSETVSVCGHVVGARTSRKGNVLLNLDKQFPNQIFTVFVRKENLVNFSYDPEQAFKGKTICVKGKIISLGGTPAMFIEKEEAISEWE
jgi:endonuclease G